MRQEIFSGKEAYKKIKEVLQKEKVERFLLVCDKAFEFMYLKDYLENTGIDFVKFDDFRANPLYDEVKVGVELLKKSKCDFIISIGGGSAIDVAKCIKLYSNLDDDSIYLDQEYKETSIKHLSIPSTAGTGSESTKFAVIYYNNEKQSIAHDSIVPEYVVLEPELLRTLPIYQKKATFLDALCQAVESIWSVNSNDESRDYAKEAITIILKYYSRYLDNDEEALIAMSRAANLSGQAINITQTTAAHAMSYKITSKYNLAHGHAVAICLPNVWNFINSYENKSDDLIKALNIINESFGTSSTSSVDKFTNILKELELTFDKEITNDEIDELVKSVNIVRLKNTPVSLKTEDLKQIYIATLQ